MAETLVLRGTLEGHEGWVTSIATPQNLNSDVIISASRDKTLLVWKITREEGNYGYPLRSLHGHSHFVEVRPRPADQRARPIDKGPVALSAPGFPDAARVPPPSPPPPWDVGLMVTERSDVPSPRQQDVVMSSDGQFALSGSWDGTLRLWDLNTGNTTRRFIGHTKDVLSVAFSVDNRQIVSASRDKTIKLWNTLGECKWTITGDMKGHSEWVSCVRFSPVTTDPIIVSGGWDKMVKVWSLQNCTLRKDLKGHTGYVNTTTVSPDGSLCGSGGKDGVAMLWDLGEGKRLYSLDAGDIIHALCFSPNRYWLCAATQSCIKIWDLETKTIVDEVSPEFLPVGKKAQTPYCTSLAWSKDGQTLFAGYTDHKIRVWCVDHA